MQQHPVAKRTPDMNWYYLNDNEEVTGPLSEDALRDVRDAGTLQATTKVRREGTEEWMSFDQAFNKNDDDPAEGSVGGDPASIEVALCTKTSADKSPNDESHPTFADTLKQQAKDGLARVKRYLKQAALKAQIEKLRNMDLRKAHHTLGQKCFKSGVLETELLEEFQAIRDLDTRITKKRETAGADADESKMAALKRVSKDAANVSHAQALRVKRERLISELGKQAYARRTELSPEGPRDDLSAITDIEARIRHKDEAMRLLGEEGKRLTTRPRFADLWNSLQEPAFPREKNKTTRIGLATKRLLAFLIDGIVAFSIILLLSLIVPNPTDAIGAFLLIGATILFCVYLVTMERSRTMSTVGKFLLGLRVVDGRGRRITSREAGLRSAISGILIIPLILAPIRFPWIYELLEHIGEPSFVLTGIIVLIYAVYFALSLLTDENCTPHDLFSRTRVVGKEMVREANVSTDYQDARYAPQGNSGSFESLPAAVGAGISTPLTSPRRRFAWRFAFGTLVALGCTGLIVFTIISTQKPSSPERRQSSSGSTSNHGNPCERCRGSGQLVGQCRGCYGAGTIMTKSANYDGISSYRQPMQVPCPQCRGNGKMPVPCQHCGGTGSSSY